jgi:hypothetical protein
MPRVQKEEKILRVAKEKNQITYKGKLIRITSELSADTLKAKKALNTFLALRVIQQATKITISSKVSTSPPNTTT